MRRRVPRDGDGPGPPGSGVLPRGGLVRARPAIAPAFALLASACAVAPAGPATPAAVPTPAPTTPVPATPVATAPAAVPATLDDLQAAIREIAAADAPTAGRRVDALWTTLADAGRVPLVLGDDVVFLYRGEAEEVHWRGSFNGWSEPGLAGTRVGATDLWMALATLPAPREGHTWDQWRGLADEMLTFLFPPAGS